MMTDKDEDSGSGENESKEVEILAEYLDYYEQNNDFVGWISLYPYIQYPVVQYTDNEYYLKHNFSGGYNENGTIFADYQGKITADSMPGNTLLYGHNLITNNYFQPLSNYRKKGMDFISPVSSSSCSIHFQKTTMLLFSPLQKLRNFLSMSVKIFCARFLLQIK